MLSEVDHPVHQQFTDAELRAIVEVAGLADRVVAAHCHGKPGIMAALAAGVRTIEHGTYLDEEAAAAMRETGAILVPTRTIIADILDSQAAPPYALAKLAALADQHAEAVALAREAQQQLTAARAKGPGRAATDKPRPSEMVQWVEPAEFAKMGATPRTAPPAGATPPAPAAIPAGPPAAEQSVGPLGWFTWPGRQTK